MMGQSRSADVGSGRSFAARALRTIAQLLHEVVAILLLLLDRIVSNLEDASRPRESSEDALERLIRHLGAHRVEQLDARVELALE